MLNARPVSDSPYLRHMDGLSCHRCMDHANDVDPFRGPAWLAAFRVYAEHLGYFQSCRAECTCPIYPHRAECTLVRLYEPDESELIPDDLPIMIVDDIDPWQDRPHVPGPSRIPMPELLGLAGPVPDDAEWHGEIVESDPDKLLG